MMLIGYVSEDGKAFHASCNCDRDIREPILNNQGEWDSYLTCEECKQEIDDVQLSPEGFKWLHATGRKKLFETWADAFQEVDAGFYIALGNNGNWYCYDCFVSDVLHEDQSRIAQLYHLIKHDQLMLCP